MASCFKCGEVLPRELQITRTVECPVCNQPVRCCRNCVFYLPGAHWDCRETVPEQVTDKERANFCEYFRLNGGNTGAKGNTAAKGSNSSSTPVRRAFDDLFS
jgi:hypothetical protein